MNWIGWQHFVNSHCWMDSLCVKPTSWFTSWHLSTVANIHICDFVTVICLGTTSTHPFVVEHEIILWHKQASRRTHIQFCLININPTFDFFLFLFNPLLSFWVDSKFKLNIKGRIRALDILCTLYICWTLMFDGDFCFFFLFRWNKIEIDDAYDLLALVAVYPTLFCLLFFSHLLLALFLFLHFHSVSTMSTMSMTSYRRETFSFFFLADAWLDDIRTYMLCIERAPAHTDRNFGVCMFAPNARLSSGRKNQGPFSSVDTSHSRINSMGCAQRWNRIQQQQQQFIYTRIVCRLTGNFRCLRRNILTYEHFVCVCV